MIRFTGDCALFYVVSHTPYMDRRITVTPPPLHPPLPPTAPTFLVTFPPSSYTSPPPFPDLLQTLKPALHCLSTWIKRVYCICIYIARSYLNGQIWVQISPLPVCNTEATQGLYLSAYFTTNLYTVWYSRNYSYWQLARDSSRKIWLRTQSSL